jgi:hypothetical protein
MVLSPRLATASNPPLGLNATDRGPTPAANGDPDTGTSRTSGPLGGELERDGKHRDRVGAAVSHGNESGSQGPPGARAGDRHGSEPGRNPRRRKKLRSCVFDVHLDERRHVVAAGVGRDHALRAERDRLWVATGRIRRADQRKEPELGVRNPRAKKPSPRNQHTSKHLPQHTNPSRYSLSTDTNPECQLQRQATAKVPTTPTTPTQRSTLVERTTDRSPARD